MYVHLTDDHPQFYAVFGEGTPEQVGDALQRELLRRLPAAWAAAAAATPLGATRTERSEGLLRALLGTGADLRWTWRAAL